MYSAFQFGFQSGFQVIYAGGQTAPNGNRPHEISPYIPTSHELRHIDRLNRIEQLKEQERVAQRDLKAKEIQIEDLELQRLREGLADQRLQAELLQLMLEQQAIIAAMLEFERMIQLLMEEDEAILVILLTMPF